MFPFGFVRKDAVGQFQFLRDSIFKSCADGFWFVLTIRSVLVAHIDRNFLKVEADFIEKRELSISKAIALLVVGTLRIILKSVALLAANIDECFLKLCSDFTGFVTEIILKVAATICSLLVGLAA